MAQNHRTIGLRVWCKDCGRRYRQLIRAYRTLHNGRPNPPVSCMPTAGTMRTIKLSQTAEVIQAGLFGAKMRLRFPQARFLQRAFATLFCDVSYAQAHCSWHYRYTFQILPNQHFIPRLAGGSPGPGPPRQLGWPCRRRRWSRYESQRLCQLPAR